MGSAVAGAAAFGAVAGAAGFVPKVGAVPIGRGSAAPRSEPVPVPSNWTMSADVVVVGYGGAGAITAITAFDMGAKVLILEKTPSLASLGVTNGTTAYTQISGGGGNTHMSGGGVESPNDPVAAVEGLYNGAWGATPMPYCQAWDAVAYQNKAWLDAMGIKYAGSLRAQEYPGLPGIYAGMTTSYMIAGAGAGFFQALDGLVQSRGIPVAFNTRATDLVQDPKTNEILGVQAIQNMGEMVNIQAKRAVVLCTGGFEYNEDMKLNYLRSYPVHFYGWQFNTGDGIEMGLKVGAGLWHTNSMAGRPILWNAAWSPTATNVSTPSNNYIYVNKYGYRYVNEVDSTMTGHGGWIWMEDFNPDVPEYTRIPSFIIFDETLRLAGPIGPQPTAAQCELPSQLGGAPAWSTTNLPEIAKGWIIKGQTSIADLANAINSATIVDVYPGSGIGGPATTISFNIDPKVLTATVNTWNQAVAAKSDAQFGRAASTMAPIVTPPFYAVAVWPGGPNTNGGPIRNEKAQVCRYDGTAIPRLYSAGELGSGVAFLYPTGSSNLGELVAFGRIAGNNATNEVPWTS